MTTHVLIIGGLGYIGNVLYEIIQKEDWHVEIFDNHLYPELEPIIPFIKGDTRNISELEENIKKFDIIINLAAVVGDPGCLVDTNQAIDINCNGTRNIADLCKKYNKRVIHISTCSIYGSEPNRVVSEEDTGFPIDFYGQTKYTQERLIREICEENSCVLRLGTAYGLSPRMRYDLVVNIFAARAIIDKKITVFGGEQERPFVHIKDISRAIIHVIKNNLNGLFNLQGDNLSLLNLANIVKDYTGCKVEIKTEITDNRSYMVDNSKLIKTGFKYMYHIIDAIKAITASPTVYKMNEVIYSNYKLNLNLKTAKTIKNKKIKIIEGGLAIDDRGELIYANDFHFYGVKRFYQVKNFSNSTIRAWHGHLNEAKYVFVSKGSAIVAAVKLKNVQNPSKNEKVKRYILSDKKPRIIFIPPGYANGFRALESDTIIYFFSTATLEETKGDDYRFPIDYWGKKIWEVEDR